MKTKIRVVEHLPFEERERRYRKAKDGLARGHWQVIWLIAQGTPAQHVAEMTSYSYTWVRTLVQRYNQDGPEALSDGRHANAGGQYILSVLQQQQLQEALEHDPSDGGLWSGRKRGMLDRRADGSPGPSSVGLGVSSPSALSQTRAASPSRER